MIFRGEFGLRFVAGISQDFRVCWDGGNVFWIWERHVCFGGQRVEYYGLNCVTPKFMLLVLQDVTLFGDYFAALIKLKWSNCGRP